MTRTQTYLIRSTMADATLGRIEAVSELAALEEFGRIATPRIAEPTFRQFADLLGKGRWFMAVGTRRYTASVDPETVGLSDRWHAQNLLTQQDAEVERRDELVALRATSGRGIDTIDPRPFIDGWHNDDSR